MAKLYQNADDDDFLFAQKLRSIPRRCGMLEALMYYDTMVSNGGHQQYFRNSKGAYRDLVEDGLRLYASDYHFRIFQRALFRYDPVFHSVYGDLEASTPPPTDFRDLYDDLDELYFDADPKLAKLVDQYIRYNLEHYRG